MAVSNLLGVSPQSFVSGAAVGQYRVVKLDSTEGRVIVTSAITDSAVGVSMQSASAAGELVPVQQFGKAKVVASGAVSIGDQVMPTGSGSGKCVTASGATAKSFGVALTAANADGDIIEVQLGVPAINGPANS